MRIEGQEVNFSIETHFWICFEEIARVQATTAEQLAKSIVATQTADNLPSAIRTFVLKYFQRQSRTLENVEPARSPAALTAMADTWIDDTWIDGTRPRWLN